MDQAIAFNPQIVVQEAKDIVDTIEEKGTSIRLMVIIGWSEGSNMDHSWLQFKFVSYLSFTILLNHSMYDFRSTLRRASTLSSPRFQESCLH